MVFAEQPVSSWLVCSRLDPMSPRPALDSLSPVIRTPRASGSQRFSPGGARLGDITAISAAGIRSEALLKR